MPPEKSETMVLLGQNTVGYKIVVDNKFLQKYRILNISVFEFPVKMEWIF